MPTNQPSSDDLAALIDDSAARTEPLEEHFIIVDGPLVVYTGPGRVAHPWSATEYAARQLEGLEKDRSDGFDAVDPRQNNLFDDATDKIETKAARIGRAKSTGRFAVRDEQHSRLVDVDGDYVLLTYEQINDRIVYIGDHVRVSADTMEDLVQRYSWSRRDRAGAEEREVRVPHAELPWIESDRSIREAFVLDYAL